jgi:uncharacterized protein (TIGR00288 family)
MGSFIGIGRTHPREFHRVMVFIDGSNMVHSSQRFQKGFKIDYKKLVNVLVENRQLIRPYFFGSYDPNKKVGEKFYEALSLQGFEIIKKPLRSRAIGEGGEIRQLEKGVDVALVTRLLSLAFEDTFDVAIIVSGDTDYIDAIRVIKDLGKRVEIAAFKGSIGRDLKFLADKFIAIDDIAEQIKI